MMLRRISQRLQRTSALLFALMPVISSAEANRAITITFWQQLPAAYGIGLIILSLPILLVGWWLIRWLSALSTAGAVTAAVLFTLMDRTAATWAWTAAICVGILAGFLGWFLFTLLFTAQFVALGWLAGYHLLLFTAPPYPVAALVAGGIGALIGGLFGWRLAPIAAIIQTVMIGFVGIVAGMLILCQPMNTGERVLLTLIIGVITIPAGAWVQWRSHHKPDKSQD